MTKIPAKHRPNKNALVPLLDKELEKKRLESIEKETKKEQELNRVSKNISNILKKEV